MKLRILSLSLLALPLCGSAWSQTVYDLKECIKTGLEKNYSLLITKNSEAIARNNYSIGNAGFLPSLGLNGRHSESLDATYRNIGDSSMSSSTGNYSNSSSIGLSLGLTIFNGFSVQTTYKKLNELKQVGELNTQMGIENLIGDITSAYYNYIQQIQLLKNLEFAVSLSKERLRIDEDRYLLGSGSKLQVLQSRVYLNSDSSRLSKQFEVVRTSQIRLNELMAVEDMGDFFVSNDTSINVNHELIYEKLLEETLLSNTRLLIAAKNKTISEYDYKLIKSRSYPYIDLNTGSNLSFSAFSNGNQLSNGSYIGLNFGVNIFNGFNQRRSIRNSSIELKNKELIYLEIEQGIKADLITIYSVYSSYLRLIKLEQQNLQTATENLTIAMERYRLGNLSGIDLREVQKSLLDARESLLSVLYQTKLAEITLNLISGRIMDYYR